MTFNLAHLLAQRRFRPPADWDWSFRTIDGIKIRYGQTRSRKAYDAVVVVIGGLGDFGEQYFELANELDAHNMKPLIIDMPGQGGSGRYLPDEPHKRHSVGFDKLLSDLHILIDEVAHSTAIDAEDNHKRLPVILLAHSMAGHIALRYLSEYNKSSRGTPIFSAAAVTAPMLAIRAVNMVPAFLRGFVIKLLALRPTTYVPGGSAWFEGYRDRPRFKGIFSSDPERLAVQAAYFGHPEYQHLVIGSPTTKWLADAVTSCAKIRSAGYLEKIDIPVLVAIAGEDKLVINDATREAVKRMKHGELMEISGSQHEIIMEANQYRTPFIERFFTFVEENVLNKPDKGKTYIQ